MSGERTILGRWWLGVGLAVAVVGAASLGYWWRGFEPPRAPSPVATPLLPTIPQPGEGGSTPGLARCYIGALVARESVDVGSELTGTLARVAVRVGDEVVAGAVLAEIDRRDLLHAREAEAARRRQIEATAKRMELEAHQAAEELQRRRQLDGLVSREELEAAQLRYDQKTAAAEAGRAELEEVNARIVELDDRLARAVVRAPFAGRVAQRYLDPGARVEVGTSLVKLLGAADYLVRFAVPPEAVNLVPKGRAVRIEVTEPRLELAAEVSQIAPEIDQDSLLIFVEARLATPFPSQVALGSESWVGFAGEPSCLPAQATGH